MCAELNVLPCAPAMQHGPLNMLLTPEYICMVQVVSWKRNMDPNVMRQYNKYKVLPCWSKLVNGECLKTSTCDEAHDHDELHPFMAVGLSTSSSCTCILVLHLEHCQPQNTHKHTTRHWPELDKDGNST